jgi:hypothetical protein
VIEEGGGRKVIERLIYRLAGDGTRGQPEKVRIEERKNADGSVNVDTQVYRGDINGRLQLVERSSTEASKQGDAVRSTTTVQRASANGGLEVVERRERSGIETKESLSEEVRTFRRDMNGSFREAVRTVTERKQSPSGAVNEQVSEYHTVTIDGRMQLSSQRVATEVKAADGSLMRDESIYGTVQAGRPSTAGEMKLREQRRIEQRPNADQTVTETLSIRRPDLEGRVQGGYVKVGDRVCRGKCAEQP